MNPVLQPLLALPAVSLWRREVVRFLRQRSRIIGALATPIVFWLLLGSGLRRSFQLPGVEAGTDYLAFFFPGTIIMIVLFTAIFSTISIIEDRKEGFLQSVLVAPVRRSAIVLGKVLGATTLALGQALLFMALAPLAGVPLSVAAVAASAAVLLVVSLGLAGLGFVIAWSMDSTQGFHAIMNLFLMPMWILSGAVFPAAGASAWIAWIMMANPLTYGMSALRHAMSMGTGAVTNEPVSWPIAMVVTILFAAAMVMAASWCVGRDAKTHR